MNIRYRVANRIGLPALALGALFAGANAQNLEQNITMTVNASTMSNALQQIAEEVGFPIQPNADIANEVISFRFTDKPLTEALNKIADVSGGEWVPTGGGFRLARRSQFMQQLQRQEAEARAEIIRAAVNQRIQAVRDAGSFDPNQSGFDLGAMQQGQAPNPTQIQQMMRMRFTNPQSRAVIALLNMIPINQLSSIGVGERVVFSDNPTQMQRRIPGNASSVAQQAIQQQIAAGQAAQSSPDGARRGAMNPQALSRLENARIGKTYLILTGVPAGLSVQMVITDTEGEVLTTGMDMLASDAQMMGAFMRGAAAMMRGGQDESTPSDDERLNLSETQRQFAKLFGQGRAELGALEQVFTIGAEQAASVAVDIDLSAFEMFSGGGLETATGDALEILLRPDVTEPLSLFVAPAVGQLTDGKDFVALFDDRTLRIGATYLANEFATRAGFRSFLRENGYEFSEEDGYVVIKPTDFLGMIRSRVDRPALATALQNARSGSMSLATRARYVQTAPSLSTANSLDRVLASVVSGPGVAGQFARLYGAEREALTIFGSLSASQMNVLANGGTLPIFTAHNDRNFWHNSVFNSQRGPTRVRQQNRQTQAGGGRQVQALIAQGGGGGIMQMFAGGPFDERTDFLPNGIPSSSTLSMRSQSQPVLRATDANQQQLMFLTPRELATRQAFANANLPMMGGRGGGQRQNAADLERFQVGQRSSYTFTVTLAQGVTMTYSLSEDTVDGNARTVGLDGLPADIREQYDRALRQSEEAARRAAEGMQNMGQRQNTAGSGSNRPPL